MSLSSRTHRSLGENAHKSSSPDTRTGLAPIKLGEGRPGVPAVPPIRGIRCRQCGGEWNGSPQLVCSRCDERWLDSRDHRQSDRGLVW